MRYSIFVFLLIILSCKTLVDSNTQVNGEEVLSELPASFVSIKAPVFFTFKDGVKVSQDKMEYSLTPEVKGDLKLVSGSTYGFYPEESFQYGTKYSLSIILKEEGIKFSVPFETKDLQYNIKVSDHLEYLEEKASIKGLVLSSDWVDEEEVKKLFQIDSGNGIISWTHSKNGKNHSFTISEIQRKDNDYSYHINWNQKQLNFSGQKEYTILSKGQFRLTDIQESRGNRTISLHFSQPLDPFQRLEGLIRVEGETITNFRIEGSTITIFLQDIFNTNKELFISRNVISSDGKLLPEEIAEGVQFDPLKPEIRRLSTGAIVPNREQVLFSFEAIGLNAVDVEVLKVFESNVLQFLQNNRLDERSYYLEPIGRIIHQQVADLSSQGKDIEKWSRYTLDLSHFINVDPGAIYVVRIGFRRDYTEFRCEDGYSEGPLVIDKESPTTIMRWNYQYPGYKYSHESNPCYPVYYNENRFIQSNLLASNLGIIAKRGDDNRFSIHVRDIYTLKPIQGVKVGLYDFQQQLVTEGVTNDSGHLTANVNRAPSFLVATYENEYGYLNIRDQYANSLTDFDIGGQKKSEGIDAFIYGERGVWRPGDTLFLTTMITHSTDAFPEDHPVNLIVKNSRGKKVFNSSTNNGMGGIYTFRVPTDENDPTGIWNAEVNVGNQSFYKSLRVETIKPNRLKMELDIPRVKDISETMTIPFTASWLHGAKASNLQANVEVSYSSTSTSFPGYNSYSFEDPARKIGTTSKSIFKDRLDVEGSTNLLISKGENFLPPGKVKMRIKSRVFENSGEYSEDNLSFIADPYSQYVGIKSPESRWGSNYLTKEGDEGLMVVVVDHDGNPVPNAKVNLGLYEAEWQWWYSRSNNNIYKYDAANHLGASETTILKTDSNGTATWRPSSLDHYRYLVRACDDESGHCTGILVYTSYYDDQTNEGGANILSVSSDKTGYTVGESMKLEIPSNESSQIYISIENGSSVLKEYWIKGQQGLTEVQLPIEASMAPNIYVHVTLIQEEYGESSDLPMRMYGVLPLNVSDPLTVLSPKIVAPSEIQPKETYSLTVSEDTGKEMYYTLAVVDEGLLNLTRFNTPNPHQHFNAKQSLGVKTWDLYDMVIQGYGNQVERFISIGGDGEINGDPGDRKANRFNPVVDFYGPFHLDKDQTNTHEMIMDNYMGEVRAMIVAINNKSFGLTQQSIKVSNPVVLLPTFPRVVSPNSTIDLPVNVFATTDDVDRVVLEIVPGPGLEVLIQKNVFVDFSSPGDELITFPIEIEEYTGPSYLNVKATYGGKTVDQRIDFHIENANPITYDVHEIRLEAGQNIDVQYAPYGTKGNNNGVVEISTFPPINLEHRLEYLIRYPYGCVEQTTSSVFPQLYLTDMVELSDKEEKAIEKNIQSGIKRLMAFQTTSGGLSYWKGSNEISEWGTSYAGHFLIESKEKGYYVASEVLENWARFQKEESTYFRIRNNSRAYLMQAYRLYTLAKYGEPEWGAMNYLKSEDLNSTATYILAAAYAVASKPEIAESMIRNLNPTTEPYQELSYTYGSALRDQSLMAEAMLVNGMSDKSRSLVYEIAKELGSDQWQSTQTTAFALLAVGKYLSQVEIGTLEATLKDGNATPLSVSSDRAVHQYDISTPEVNHELSIRNTSQGELFVRIIRSGKRGYGLTRSQDSHLDLTIQYKSMEGKEMDVANITQGEDFIAEITINNPRTKSTQLDELALTYVVPPGWEIINDRVSGNAVTVKSDEYDYKDIRDDRVHFFFDLKAKKTFRIKLTATYAGKYYLPDSYCTAMYDRSISAIKAGKWIEVSKSDYVQ